jgi:hypothetical protein
MLLKSIEYVSSAMSILTRRLAETHRSVVNAGSRAKTVARRMTRRNPRAPDTLFAMRRKLASRSSVDRLLEHLMDGVVAVDLSDELRAWLHASPRLRAFADAHRDKIRKKLRTARDAGSLLDVRAELRAAHLLLADRRLDLEFEAFGSTKGGPDFVVRFRSGRSFGCEVTRMRREPAGVGDGGPLLGKLRQMTAGMANLLVIAADGTRAADLDVDGAVRALRSRADVKEESFFTRRGFTGTRDFHARFSRLGGVITWCEAGDGDARAEPWTNASARIALPPPAMAAVLACLRRR